MIDPDPRLTPDRAARLRPGLIATLVILAIYGGIAVSVDFPRTAQGFKGDEATYYLMGHSLAADRDLTYRREDLERVWKEFQHGPSGVFLKRGQHVRGVHLENRPPFLAISGTPDRDPARLYYGKAFIYPALAAPFVWLLGTNGFLLFNALLLSGAFLTAYVFLSARTTPTVALVLASAFIFASVVPVYFVWIAPELFNFALGLLAYFLWAHKAGPGTTGPMETETTGTMGTRPQWLYGPVSDWLAAGIIGLLTFSKVTNCLLLLPIVGWYAWRRRWRHVVFTTASWAVVTMALFGVNTAITGDWNYQGGARSTFYANDGFPFQTLDKTFDAGDARARNEGRGDVILDPDMFWTNLRANLWYVFFGRYSGIAPYFFPAFFAIVTFLLAHRRRALWQWLVLASLMAQILVFIISQPYTYFGSGGSVGNRYFTGAYGLALFLLPPIRSLAVSFVPWIVGGMFTARLVLNPFYTSIRPFEHAMDGPLRMFPVELTNINDLPTNTNRDQLVFEYGKLGESDPMFQLYYTDDNAYLRELDRSFWVRGESTAEVLIKTDRPYRTLQLTLSAGSVPAAGTVTLAGKTQTFSLTRGANTVITLDLGPGFPYKKDRESLPPEYQTAYIWVLKVTAGRGFVPKLFDEKSVDVRYLGVNVRPMIVQ